jgi:regulator of sigma E protease
MFAILAPILVFGLVIFVHELGHFLAAKSVGVYTPRFSIGFGPALWRRRRGETEYILAAFPLGGYVRMASRHDESTAFLEGGSEESAARKTDDPNFDPNAMIPFGPKPVPENRWFESKPLWARLYILLAGVTMNFALGLVVAISLAFYYGRVVIPASAVGGVRPIAGTTQLSSVVHPGDTIRRVNGEPVSTWSGTLREIASSEGRVEIETNRGSVTIPLDEPGAPTAEDVAIALDNRMPPVLGGIVPDQPASRAGFQAGDTIESINGSPIETWNDMVVRVANSSGTPLTFTVRRKSGRVTLRVTPQPRDAPHPVTGKRGQVGKIGAYPVDLTVREPVTLGEAVTLGTRTAWFMGTSIVGTVRDLITRRVSVDQLGGPIAITRASVDAARSGFESLFYLIALLSINVAILNLLPIPILDGGQVLINVLESARGRPFSLRTREYILRGGLMVILLLFVLVMFNDTRAMLFR